MSNVPPGTKYDDNKLDWTMLPWDQLEVLAMVLEHGEKKYARDNWQQVKDGKFRYLKAAFRHLIAWAKGEENDKDSGLPHWAHACVCLLFVGWFAGQKNEAIDNQRYGVWLVHSPQGNPSTWCYKDGILDEFSGSLSEAKDLMLTLCVRFPGSVYEVRPYTK